MTCRAILVSLVLPGVILAAPGRQGAVTRSSGIYVAASDAPGAGDAAVRLRGQRLTDIKTHNVAASALTMGLAKPTQSGQIPGAMADFRRPSGDLVFYFYLSQTPPPDPAKMDPMQALAQMGSLGGDVMPADATTADSFRLVEVFPNDHVRVIDLPSMSNPSKVKNAIDEAVERLDQGIYRMKPKRPLKPGEYALLYIPKAGIGNQVWDFGIDAH